MFQNADGKKTLRVFNHPVKFIDEKGDIRDISLEITSKTGGGFKTAANSVVTEFSSKLSGGITLTHDDVNIKMVPGNTGLTIPTASLSGDKKTVRYQIDSKTAYDYSLTYTGFKEDIVVNEYTGQTSFLFTLYTGGLILSYEDGRYVFVDKSGNVKAVMSDIIIFTADERNNGYGSMSYKTVRAGEEYRINIQVDGEYLRDENTKYPIKIDPTISIIYEQSGENAIEDVIIKENATYTGSFGSLYIGRHADGYLSRVLMRFPGLDLDNLSFYNKIEKATVEIRDLMCQGNEPMYIECYSYTGATWSEASTPTWSSVGSNYVGELLDSHLITYANGNVYNEEITVRSQRYSYDITALAQDWMMGRSSPEKGIVFKATDAFEYQTGDQVQNWKKTFSSYEREVHKPSLKIVYTSSIRLDYYSLNINEGSNYIMGVTTNPKNQTVTWTSSNSNVATVSQTGVISGVKAGTAVITASYVDEDGVTVSASCNVYVTIPDGVYSIKNRYSNLYLNVPNGGIGYGLNVEQDSAYTSSDTLINQLSQQWKIVYVGEGYYTIRPMHKLDMGLSYIDGKACITDIGLDNTLSDIPDMALWKIEGALSGRYLRNKSAGNGAALYPENASNTVGAQMTVDGWSPATSVETWTLTAVTNVASGVLFYDKLTGEFADNPTRYIAPEQSKTLNELDLDISIYSYTHSLSTIRLYEDNVQWSVSNTARVRFQNKKFDALIEGGVTANCTMAFNGSSYSFSFNIIVINSGATYYIRRLGSSKFIDIQNQTMSNGTNIIQHDFGKDDYRNSFRWIITQLDDGYFTIKSANSTTDYYLGVENDSTANNANIVLRSGTITDGMKWKFVVATNGALKIISKFGEQNNYVLGLTVDERFISQNGLLLKQCEQDNVLSNIYTDEWELIQLLPTSGYELEFDPSIWNYFPVVGLTNCYFYAINNQLCQNGELLTEAYQATPGGYDEEGYITNEEIVCNADLWLEKVLDDFSDFSTQMNSEYKFEPIGRYDVCPSGTYKVALVIAPGVDCHWYRQNPDGLWSHKQGVAVPQEVDYNNSRIVDPQLCNRGEYTEFIGYFAVTPWNQYYTA